MKNCEKCGGKGRYHTADTLAHDEDGCLWCEECPLCKGSGQYTEPVILVSDKTGTAESAAPVKKTYAELRAEQKRLEAEAANSKLNKDAVKISPEPNVQTRGEEAGEDSAQTSPTLETTPQLVINSNSPLSDSSKIEEISDEVGDLNIVSSNGEDSVSVASSRSNSVVPSSESSRPETPAVIGNGQLGTVSPSKNGSSPRRTSFFSGFKLKNKSSQSLPGAGSSGQGAPVKINSAKQTDKLYLQLVEMFSTLGVVVEDDFGEVDWVLGKTEASTRPLKKQEDSRDFVPYNLLAPMDRATTNADDYTSNLERFFVEDGSRYSDDYAAAMFRFEMGPMQFLKTLKSFYYCVAPDLDSGSSVTGGTVSAPSDDGQNSPTKPRMSISGQQPPRLSLSGQAQPRLSLSGQTPPVLGGTPTRDSRLVQVERDAKRRRDVDDKQRKEYLTRKIPEIKNKVVKVLLKWMRNYWLDFEPEILGQLNVWISRMIESEDDYSAGVQLQETLRLNKLNQVFSLYSPATTASAEPSPSASLSPTDQSIAVESYLQALNEKFKSFENSLEIFEEIFLQAESAIYSELRMEYLFELMLSIRAEPRSRRSILLQKFQKSVRKFRLMKNYLISAVLLSPTYKSRQNIIKHYFKAISQFWLDQKINSVYLMALVLFDKSVLSQSIAFSALTSKNFKLLKEISDYFQGHTDSTFIQSFKNQLQLAEVEYEPVRIMQTFLQSCKPAPNATTNPILVAVNSSVFHSTSLGVDLRKYLEQIIEKGDIIVNDIEMQAALREYCDTSDLYFNNYQYGVTPNLAQPSNN